MARKAKRSQVGLKFIGMLKNAIDIERGAGLPSICHRIPFTPPDASVATTYTVYLSPDSNGTFLVTCRELPEVTTFGEDEDDALTMAQLAIEEALAARRRSSDYPG